jgi:tetratricopeptide (TPR) repeat protein
MAKNKKHHNRKSSPQTPLKDASPIRLPHFVIKHRIGLFLGGLVVLTLLIYASGLNGPLVFDDMSNIEYNPHIRLEKLSFDGLKKAAFDSPAEFRPVANISFALNYWLHGYKTSGFHLVNVLIHVTTGVFLFFFIRLTLRMPALSLKYESHQWVAYVAALIWLVHPLQTQSVTYIVQRMNSMAAMFYVMALFFYACGRVSQTTQNRWLWFGGCAAAGILALGTKQIAATLPFFIFLYEWYFLQDLNWHWFKRRMLPLAGVLLFFGILALIYLGADPLESILGGYQRRDFTLLERVLTQFRVVVFYISLIGFPLPSRLNLDRDFALSHSLLDPVTTLLCMVTIAGLLFFAWRLAPRQRLISFCILWFFGNLVIESSVIGLEIIFDHRTYLPSMMVCLLAVILLYSILRSKWACIGVLAVVAMAFSFWTYERNAVFRDQISIWGDCVAKSPNKARPHNNLGIFLKRKGRLDEARMQFEKALQLKPDYPSAHINMGATLVRQKKLEAALEHFAEAARIRKNFPEALYSMGTVLVLLGRSDEAQGHYEKALAINPDYADAHLKLADILDQKGRQQEAIAHYKKALRVNPHYLQAHNNLGVTLAKQGKLEEATGHFARAMQIRPKDAEAHFNMGNVKANQGRYKEAAAYFAKALKLNPKDREAHQNLKKVQQLMKNSDKLRSDAGN